jgi:hypothetical protein
MKINTKLQNIIVAAIRACFEIGISVEISPQKLKSR